MCVRTEPTHASLSSTQTPCSRRLAIISRLVSTLDSRPVMLRQTQRVFSDLGVVAVDVFVLPLLRCRFQRRAEREQRAHVLDGALCSAMDSIFFRSIKIMNSFSRQITRIPGVFFFILFFFLKKQRKNKKTKTNKTGVVSRRIEFLIAKVHLPSHLRCHRPRARVSTVVDSNAGSSCVGLSRLEARRRRRWRRWSLSLSLSLACRETG